MKNSTTPKKKRNARILTPDEIAYAAELYNTGKSLKEIGEVFDFGQEKVRRILIENGVERRRGKSNEGKWTINGENIDRVKELYLSGLSIPEVVAKIGFTWGAVRLTLLREGVLRSHKEATEVAWQNPEYRSKVMSGLVGKMPTTKGRTWELGYKRRPHFHKEKSHLWKGGITDLRIAIRSMSEYVHWRKSVFERDNYCCVSCGQRGGKLQADHIIRLIEVIKQNDIKTVDDARSCEALWDIKNGRTLCVPCHRQTPTYGRKLSVNSADY